MEALKQQKPERLYYIDWLRILLILSVFLFHIGMIFNSWDWHVKNDVTASYKSLLWYIMVFLGRWRMPLLILISGAGTFLALGKRTSWQYLGERFKRLFIPLTIGIFILVPVQVFIERTDQYDSLWSFYPHMFEGTYPEGNFSWHHLWFIAYLFFIALLISPFLKFLRSLKFDLFLGRISRIVSRNWGANIFLAPIVTSQILLRPYFPENTHGLFDDWAAVSSYILFFLAGYLLISSREMIESIYRQRRLFLFESAASTFLLFTVPYLFSAPDLRDMSWNILEPFVAWSCGLTALGYARKYLNKNNRFRVLANEAIYPFYLLHQPIIVVIGFYVVSWDLAIVWKALLITCSSFTATILIYWFLIRPFNAMRFIFGMKMVRRERPEPGIAGVPEPALLLSEASSKVINSDPGTKPW